MISRLKSVARSGVVALVVLSFMPFSASAEPIGLTVTPGIADGAANTAQADRTYRSTLPSFTHKGTYDARRRIYRGRRGRGGPGVGVAVGLGILGAAIILDSIARSSAGSRHVRWCRARYRSYRVSDNTFKPNHGPRRRCVSPY